MYSSPPIGVLWLIVLTVPAGQVAEETVIEEEAEEAEKLPLTKKPRIEEMTNSVEESKVIFLAVVERRQRLKSQTSQGLNPCLCLLLGILTCVAYFYRKALRESYFSSASRRLIEEPRSTDTSS